LKFDFHFIYVSFSVDFELNFDKEGLVWLEIWFMFV